MGLVSRLFSTTFTSILPLSALCEYVSASWAFTITCELIKARATRLLVNLPRRGGVPVESYPSPAFSLPIPGETAVVQVGSTNHARSLPREIAGSLSNHHYRLRDGLYSYDYAWYARMQTPDRTQTVE